MKSSLMFLILVFCFSTHADSIFSRTKKNFENGPELKNKLQAEKALPPKNDYKSFSKPNLRGDNILANGNDIYVGNGGEGVIENDKIYVRDLFDDGIHLNPYFGPEADNDINKLLNLPGLASFELNLDLLARKLTDLNELSPLFGYYVLVAIKKYQWNLVDADFTPVPNDGSPLSTYRRRIPLANRFQSTIRIHSPSWKLLSPEQRIALVIHEAVYSLLRPICRTGNICVQEAYRARNIVALAFKNPEVVTYYLSPGMESQLAIPLLSERNQCFETESYIRGQVGEQEFLLSQPESKSLRKEFIKSFCRAALRVESANLSFYLKRLPIYAHERFYPVKQGGVEYLQMYLSIRDVSSSISLIEDYNSELLHQLGREILFESTGECVRELQQKTDDWFYYAPISRVDSLDLYFCRDK